MTKVRDDRGKFCKRDVAPSLCSVPSCMSPCVVKGLCNRCYLRTNRAAKRSEYNAKQRAYCAANKEKLNRQKRERRANNTECADYYHKNKEKENARVKKWRIENPEKYKAYVKEYCEKNKEHRALYNKQYREAHKEEILAYRVANKEKHREYCKLYYRLSDKEALNEKSRTRYARNSLPFRQAARKWLSKNPLKRKQYKYKRRAIETSLDSCFTTDQWNYLCAYVENKCPCCGKDCCKLTVDHIIPLSKGGTNDFRNTQPLCISCNASKCNRNTNRYIPVIVYDLYFERHVGSCINSI